MIEVHKTLSTEGHGEARRSTEKNEPRIAQIFTKKISEYSRDSRKRIRNNLISNKIHVALWTSSDVFYMQIEWRLLIGLAASALIGAFALWRGSLTPSGALGAVIIGTTIFGFGGWAAGLTLIAFFVSSSRLLMDDAV